jgi:polyhydroxyalkanoate synthase
LTARTCRAKCFANSSRTAIRATSSSNSKLEVDGQRVDLKKLTMPLLNIYGKYDHLVPPEACDQLVKRVGSTDTEDICLATGHIGIYVSSKFQEAFAPKIANWLKERDKHPQQPKSRKKASVAKASGAPKKTLPRKKAPAKRAPKKTSPKRSRASAGSTS